MSAYSHKYAVSHFTERALPTEVVLAFLLSKFTFDLSDKRILWNFAGIRFPVVEGPEEAKPALPLKVGMYKPAASA